MTERISSVSKHGCGAAATASPAFAPVPREQLFCPLLPRLWPQHVKGRAGGCFWSQVTFLPLTVYQICFHVSGKQWHSGPFSSQDPEFGGFSPKNILCQTGCSQTTERGERFQNRGLCAGWMTRPQPHRQVVQEVQSWVAV